jgi:small subunit ribosomal protein S20
MPNIKSAVKRMRTSKERQDRNRALKSNINTTRTKLVKALESGDKTQSEALYKEFCSVLDKAAKKGTIQANAASRRKSRMAHRLAALEA